MIRTSRKFSASVCMQFTIYQKKFRPQRDVPPSQIKASLTENYLVIQTCSVKGKQEYLTIFVHTKLFGVLAPGIIEHII